MCYSGKCKYEVYMGDCNIHNGIYPDDALCVVMDREIRNQVEEEVGQGYVLNKIKEAQP